MANIDRIVNVQIVLGTSAVTQISFNDLMLLVPGAWTSRFDYITSADDLLKAPFSLASNAAGYVAAQNAFSQNPTLTRLGIGRIDAGDTNPADTMVAISAANNSWYGFGEVGRTAAKAPGYAAWTEANKKLFFLGVSGDDGATATLTDVAGQLYSSKYFRSVPMHFNNAALDYPEFAWAAKKLADQPGSETWANVTLGGIKGGDLTETQVANIKFRNSNTYENFRNIAITQNGKVSGGEWIDVIRFRDWLEEQIKTTVFNQFIDRRIPYDDDGIRIIKSAMISALDLGQRRGGVAKDRVDPVTGKVIPGYTVSVPNLSNIPVADKAARVLKDMKFTAKIAGAIHATEIRGSLVYDGS